MPRIAEEVRDAFPRELSQSGFEIEAPRVGPRGQADKRRAFRGKDLFKSKSKDEAKVFVAGL